MQTYTRDKETPGTVRFQADDEDAPVRTVYVRKGHELAKCQTITAEFKAGE